MFVSRILALYSFFCVAFTQSSSVSWVYPSNFDNNPSAITVNVVDTIVIEWTGDFQTAYLWVWCDVGTPTQDRWGHFNVTGRTSWPFNPSDTGAYRKIQDWTRPIYCHLDLNFQDALGQGVNGPHFNVTSVANQQATTWSLQREVATSAVTTSTVTALSAPLSTTASNTQSNSPSSTPISSPISSNHDNDGLSTGAKAGIAIGAVVGCILLIAIAVMVWRNKRRAERHSDVQRSEMAQQAETSSQYKYQDAYQHQTKTELESQGKVELESQIAPQELHGSNVIISR